MYAARTRPQKSKFIEIIKNNASECIQFTCLFSFKMQLLLNCVYQFHNACFEWKTSIEFMIFEDTTAWKTIIMHFKFDFEWKTSSRIHRFQTTAFLKKTYKIKIVETTRCFSFKNADLNHAGTNIIQFCASHPYKCFAKMLVKMFSQIIPCANHYFLDLKCENWQSWSSRCHPNHRFSMKNIEWNC